MARMNFVKTKPVQLITPRDAARVAGKMKTQALKGDANAAAVCLMLHGGLFSPSPVMNPMA